MMAENDNEREEYYRRLEEENIRLRKLQVENEISEQKKKDREEVLEEHRRTQDFYRSEHQKNREAEIWGIVGLLVIILIGILTGW